MAEEAVQPQTEGPEYGKCPARPSWDVDIDSWITRAKRIANRELTPDERKRYLGVESENQVRPRDMMTALMRHMNFGPHSKRRSEQW
ncbi:MAG: hypothetical protein JSU73_14075 [candidate division WOR-3 bacterium]|nr:MAG: hypothetical protein JSU73_14075 [candidate division WOR-3 bacterium]